MRGLETSRITSALLTRTQREKDTAAPHGSIAPFPGGGQTSFWGPVPSATPSLPWGAQRIALCPQQCSNSSRNDRPRYSVQNLRSLLT